MALERELAKRRAALLALEKQGQADLVMAYERVSARLQDRLYILARRIAENPEPKVSWLVRQAQYHLLLASIERESSDYLETASHRVTIQQHQALTLSEQDAHALTLAALGPGPQEGVAEVRGALAGLPRKAFERIVGNAADGKPLDRLLRAAAPTTVDLVKDALAYGVASGGHPRVIAREFAKAASFPLTSALTISRTETIRAHREGSLSTFQENKDVVGSWVWVTSWDRRTCMACALQSGTEHPLSEGMGSHPNCRCSMSPRTKSWQDLGFDGIPDRRPEIKSGEDRFKALDPAEQKARMGSSKYDAWQHGHIQLSDLVQQTRSRLWGPGSREASLREALAG